MNLSLSLQFATIGVAAIVPFIAYRHARRLALSGNRQAWLDALREDVAALIALVDEVEIAARDGRRAAILDDAAKRTAFELLRSRATELQKIRYRIRLRLRAGKPLHDALIRSIEDHVRKDATGDAHHAQREAVVLAAEALIQKVWREIETGRKA